MISIEFRDLEEAEKVNGSFADLHCETNSAHHVDNCCRSSDGYRLQVDSTMEKCIESLSEENRKYYKMLVIFKDNVYLTTEVRLTFVLILQLVKLIEFLYVRRAYSFFRL